MADDGKRSLFSGGRSGPTPKGEGEDALAHRTTPKVTVRSRSTAPAVERRPTSASSTPSAGS